MGKISGEWEAIVETTRFAEWNTHHTGSGSRDSSESVLSGTERV